MTVASFIATQRTDHQIPHAVACRALNVPESTFYKWLDKPSTATELRRADIDAKVKKSFDDSGGTYGSPRVLADLLDDGMTVTKKTVEASMVRQGFWGREPKRHKKGLTRPDKRANPIKDLLKRDFAADEPDQKWCGDFKQIDTGEGALFLSSCEDLFGRRLLGFAFSDDYPTAELAKAAINMAVATRGGVVAGVIFHTDKGTQYTSDEFAKACDKLKITQSMGRVGSAHDNAPAESFFSTLEHERLSRFTYTTRDEARRDIARWIDDFYNRRRRHSTNGMKSPIDYETEHRKLQSETAEAA
jgi:transposase InsO family protein